MLIKVFGIWLMASNVTSLSERNGSCGIYMTNEYSSPINVKNISCDEVAEEINRQIREVKNAK